MSGTEGASAPIPTLVKVLVALVLAMLLAPFAIVLVLVLISAMAGGTWYYANQRMVSESRMSAVRSTVGLLARGAEQARAEGTLSACGDPEAAMAAARAQGDLKATLSPQDPGEACLLALGADSWPLYGRFWVAAGPPYEVHGVVDLDEDGELAHLVLREGAAALETVSED
jgi:hypothetical protein